MSVSEDLRDWEGVGTYVTLVTDTRRSVVSLVENAWGLACSCLL